MVIDRNLVFPSNVALRECNPELAELFCNDFTNDGYHTTPCFDPNRLQKDMKQVVDEDNIPVLRFYLDHYDKFGLNNKLFDKFISWCIEVGHNHIVKLWLDTYYKKWPLNLDELLHYAVDVNNMVIIEMLLEHNANPNMIIVIYDRSKERNVSIPIIKYALGKGKHDIAKLLFESGANLNLLERVYYHI
jgi:ankyrin repeat protein